MNTPQGENQDADPRDGSEVSFSYSEAHIRKLLAKNLDAYFPEKLSLVQEEYSVPGAGRIDILAIDAWKGFVAIEIKKVTAGRDAIGQLASYIGALDSRTRAKRSRGYLVAPAFDDGCVAASRLLPQVQLLIMETTLQLILSSATGSIAPGFLPQTKKDVESRPPWTLNIETMKLSSTLHFSSSMTIDSQHVEDKKGVHTNWGFVPFSEIILEGRKDRVAKFAKRHKVPSSLRPRKFKRGEPIIPPRVSEDVEDRLPIAAAWPLPKKT